MSLDRFTQHDSGANAPRFQFRNLATGGGKNTSKITGELGVCPERDARAYVSQRNDEKGHRYRKGNGYAISDDVLGRLEHHGVGRIFFVEVTTGTVYEYATRKYTQEGYAVPENHLADPDDPQTYRPIADATHIWPDHMAEFFIPKGEPLDDY